MRYVFNCPTCGMEIPAEAENDDQAVETLTEKNRGHTAEKHPDQPMPDNPEEMVRNGMRTAEEGEEGEGEE